MSRHPWPQGFELRYFSPAEFGDDAHKMDARFLRLLDGARHIAGVPFIITSEFRQGDPLSHGRGLAVDIRAPNSQTRFRIVWAAVIAGFTRIGVYDRHVHLDTDPTLPQQVLWVGKSQ